MSKEEQEHHPGTDLTGFNRGLFGKRPFVYPIYPFFHAGETEQLCAEVHPILHTLEVLSLLSASRTLIIHRPEPRALSAGTDATVSTQRTDGHASGCTREDGVYLVYIPGGVPGGG